MSEVKRYPVLAKEVFRETVVDNSRFIGTVGPAASVKEAQAFIAQVSNAFADATHNCWAYVIGPPGATGQVGMSDDGEPHNTAGRPMLNVLLHSDVGDVVAVVTRYFGGTKLGRGGLVRAYGQAVQAALEVGTRIEKIAWSYLKLTVGYAEQPALERSWTGFEVEKLEEAFAEHVTWNLRVPEERRAAFIQMVEDVTRGQAKIEDLEV